MASLNCSRCGTRNALSTIICQSCGAFMPKNILLSLGALGLSWASFSFYTVNLVSVTLTYNAQAPAPKATPVPAPEPRRVSYVPPPAPENPPEALSTDYVPYAKDSKGRTASIVIHLLTDEHRWKLSRWDLLENLKSEVDFSVPMRRLMNSATEIICIGASSEEIENGYSQDEGRKREEWWAGRRADSIAMWVRAALDKPINVRKLNIGHRDPANEREAQSDTSDQRRVIIVLVLKEEEGVDMDQALRDAFQQERSKQPIYETILTKYSLTQGMKFHWQE